MSDPDDKVTFEDLTDDVRGMTVGELIDLLSPMPRDAEVAILQDEEGKCCESRIAGVEIVWGNEFDETDPFAVHLMTGFAMDDEETEVGAVRLIPEPAIDDEATDVGAVSTVPGQAPVGPFYSKTVYCNREVLAECRHMAEEWNSAHRQGGGFD